MSLQSDGVLTSPLLRLIAGVASDILRAIVPPSPFLARQ